MTHHDVGGNADSPRPERAPSDRDGNAGGSASAALPRRKLVLFADGTGNAFTTQESSVWRLYEALDHTQPDQIAHYIKGVGTAGWAPLAALDGATGIGVPGNVRKLYRFLCWNWRPGDDIYIFGFSRGAFTARTLAALISSQGLVPAEIDDTPVSHAEMGRNVKAAWREYRRETVPWTKSLPTIWVTRWIRDFLLFVYHWLCRHRSYAEVRGKMNGRSEVEIAFLGLFDTVEAFGVPVEELRLAVDWAIWPISFRNHRLSHKVRHACHALALDDERTTFHPLRIDQSHLAQGQIVKEVWFTGVHSDIGGGYPESTLSFVPLVWMVEQLGDRLRFQDGEIEHFREYQSALGPRHDSRSGAAVLYRYGPRPILGGDVNGGLPVVHFAVIERMLLGCDDYAPIMLPANCLVLLPDGTRLPLRSEGETKDIDEQHAREALKAAYLAKATGPRREQEAKAFTAMSTPDATMSSLTRDTVWWRRVAYFSLLFMAGVIAAWPWIAHALVQWSEDRALEGTGALSFITNIDWVMGAVVAPLTNLLRDVLPSYAAPWLNIATYYPFLTSIVVIVTWWIWHKNGTLRDDIEERARLAWNTSRRRASMKHIDKPGPLMRFGHWMRLNASPAQRVITRGLVPAVFLIAIFGSAALIVSSSLFTGRLALGSVCSPPTVKGSAAFQTGTPVTDEPVDARALFDTRDFCWWSGLAVEKGRKYRVFLEIKEPWFDRTIMSGANGFATYEPHHYVALPERRLFAADWFQPVVRVGSKGINDLPLKAVNVMPADEFPRRMKPTLPAEEDISRSRNRYPVRLDDTAEFKGRLDGLGKFEPIPPVMLAEAGQAWTKQLLTGRVVAEFVAPESGELFFYVNDAVQIFPRLLPESLVPSWLDAIQGPHDLFYRNNSGTAKIKVQRLPAPPMPPDKPALPLASN
ncbi:uncharacterized protein (DUF2235 family) [Bradyrhizobium ottawaense]|uniref:DUF2235 domain-containing protein n=1 Tax=Bradyrhizobium ottawaense TaxID=931866 RepID=A0A2U8P702_9BRAD|nr:DUF2235 domain-containing protein [Bradyrhizobium ottawaense]AWL93532.1 DUF2235 domain-containing protein [Bradyrhizobium ottawaense]MBR1329523.1 DUF2235 domain-containing protein [Bradyrhizobium ottawaense]MBR1335763.1 DUF2235 domain-containing protein [Bradyrhizobium ottawaense]